MKIKSDFSKLWANVNRMGKHEVIIDPGEKKLPPDFELDQKLSGTSGLDVTLEVLEWDHGVPGVRGRQVMLFIPDQGTDIDNVLSGEEEGRKFHVADCKTLNTMRQQHRFGRYKATYNVSGRFQVYGVSSKTGSSQKGEAELKVCKNCLSYLNYKGYRSGHGLPKSTIYNEFDIAEFLSEYSTLFSSMPERPALIDQGGYSDDWQEISAHYRASVGYRCESCRVDLNEHRNLLHTHHISGNKRENRCSNLKALCIDCHRKQPKHNYMRVTHTNMVLINRLRKQQDLLDTSSWQKVREMADQAFDGLLRYYEKQGLTIPEVGYGLTAPDQSVVAELELAWPSKKQGIAISPNDLREAEKLGWHVLTVGQALNQMNR